MTIGQSPRADIQKELSVLLGERKIEVKGALDGLSINQVESLVPVNAHDTFHTRLANGDDVVVSKQAVTARLEEMLLARGDRPVLIACTGKFDDLSNHKNVLFPSEILQHLVDAVTAPRGRLGVLVPLAEQIEPFRQQWGLLGRDVEVAAVKPGENPDPAAEMLKEAEVDLVVLDCFGYEMALLERVRDITAVPVMSAVRCTAHVAAEMLG